MAFEHAVSLSAGRQFTRHLDESHRLSYRTIDKIVDQCAAEVLDGLRLLQRRAKLVEDAANLIGSDAFGAVVWVFSMLPIAHISTHALSHFLVVHLKARIISGAVRILLQSHFLSYQLTLR